jgi:hypothetical protein
LIPLRLDVALPPLLDKKVECFHACPTPVPAAESTQYDPMRRVYIVVISISILSYTVGSALGAVIYESGVAGPVGVTQSDVLSGSVPATNINPDVFVGVRFHTSRTAITSRIGGHFVGGSDSTLFFGAIVQLTNSNDFPDSGDLSTPDVIGRTWLSFQHPSREDYVDLSVSLEPGWYALVFGSGLFGAYGSGGAVRNGVDDGSPSYIAWQSGSPGWFDLADLADFHVFDNHRFVIEGNFTPEPSTLAQAVFTAFLLLHGGRGLKRGQNYLRSSR